MIFGVIAKVVATEAGTTTDDLTIFVKYESSGTSAGDATSRSNFTFSSTGMKTVTLTVADTSEMESVIFYEVSIDSSEENAYIASDCSDVSIDFCEDFEQGTLSKLIESPNRYSIDNIGYNSETSVKVLSKFLSNIAIDLVLRYLFI